MIGNMVFGCIWTLQPENGGHVGTLTQYQCVYRFLGLAEIIPDLSGNSSTSAGQSLALKGCQMLLRGHAVSVDGDMGWLCLWHALTGGSRSVPWPHCVTKNGTDLAK